MAGRGVLGDRKPTTGANMSTRTYEVRVQGHVTAEVLVDALRHVEVAEHELRTVLCGQFADQDELHEFLRLLRSFGLEVVEVRQVPPGSDAARSDEVSR
jgi:hypothetical protein